MGAPVKGLLVTALVAMTVAGCSKPAERFESVVQIVKRRKVDVDAEGKTTAIDFELEWDPCPGDQFQVVRGDKEFAACTDKYRSGDFVPVMVRHWWDDRGFYRWDIERMGDCPRAIEPDSLGSYEKSASCQDVVQHGQTVGFDCSRRPSKDLVRRCPWMARE